MTDTTTLAGRIGEFAAASSGPGIPDEVIDSVRSRILDTVGICLAASALPTSGAARAWASEQGGAPQAHAIGIPAMLAAPLAAFVNGTLAHSLDYDDTHLPSVLHPSASVVPAALAAAEQAHAAGRQTLEAIAVGLEVCVRLGMAGYDPESKSSLFFEHGQHATSICGALGSAVAAARIFGLSEEQIVDSLAIAASMASGIIEANRTGGTVKRMHCGWAAHAGLSAAGLARYGFTGPGTVLEGRYGFFEAWLHGDHFVPSAITDGLGQTWSVPGIFFKPYPANHFTHAAVDAAAALRQQGLTPDQVASATLGVATSIVRTIGDPLAVKQAPETGYMAQFSGPYAVAVGLFGGGGLGAALSDYTDELAHDPRRCALMAKVDVVADARCDEIFPMQFPAVLTVRTTDGRELHAEVMSNRGGPDRPLSFAEIATKFENNAARSLDPADIQTVRDAVAGLASAASLDGLFTALDHTQTRS